MENIDVATIIVALSNKGRETATKNIEEKANDVLKLTVTRTLDHDVNSTGLILQKELDRLAKVMTDHVFEPFEAKDFNKIIRTGMGNNIVFFSFPSPCF